MQGPLEKKQTLFGKRLQVQHKNAPKSVRFLVPYSLPYALFALCLFSDAFSDAKFVELSLPSRALCQIVVGRVK